MSSDGRWVAGIDGCPGGWLAVLRRVGDPDSCRIHFADRFAAVLDLDPTLSILAVDMPVGLPERAGVGGRRAEAAVRRHLGPRQSSVFSVPSRAAVACTDYRQACGVALQTSDPPRKVSRQAFHLFAKIREIDALMVPALETRVYEVHPELAFWRLNGEQPMSRPKKIGNRPSPDGLDERAALLERNGFDPALLRQRPPKGAARDDLIDAAANCVIAERIALGMARPFPEDFDRDGRGLRMAIWA